MGGRRYTGRALSYTKKYLFTGKPKCGRKRVLVIITSGWSVDKVWKPGKGLVQYGVEIFGVVTTRQTIRQITTITTTRRHIYLTSYSNLIAIADSLKYKICITPRGII